jgi:hypothetical protein
VEEEQPSATNDGPGKTGPDFFVPENTRPFFWPFGSEIRVGDSSITVRAEELGPISGHERDGQESEVKQKEGREEAAEVEMKPAKQFHAWRSGSCECSTVLRWEFIA